MSLYYSGKILASECDSSVKEYEALSIKNDMLQYIVQNSNIQQVAAWYYTQLPSYNLIGPIIWSYDQLIDFEKRSEISREQELLTEQTINEWKNV